MPLLGNTPDGSAAQWEPQAAGGRLASTAGAAQGGAGVANYVWGAHATGFSATGTAIRRLSADHRLPDTSPRPAFTLTLDQ